MMDRWSVRFTRGAGQFREGAMATLEVKSVEHLLGSGVPYAYAVKAGSWIFLTGHEGFDFDAGITEAVAGAPGFPLFGRPRWRREGDFIDRKSTRLNSSHRTISYAVFCLKKK